MSGWIKLHRQIVNSSKFADPDILRLWILCLTKAAHKETIVVIEKREISLIPGQFVTGRFSLHQDYNALLSPRKKIPDTTLWNWLKRLESWGDLDIKTTNKYSVVTVLKWNEYQEGLTANRQQIDNGLTADEQQIDTNKNVKNVKNDNKEIIKDIVLFLNDKTGKKFKHTTESTFKAINARLSEGYTIDDFKKVITTKSDEWLTDPKMNKYLCPDTLFRPSNFEKYLNQGVEQGAIDGECSKDPYAEYDFGF